MARARRKVSAESSWFDLRPEHMASSETEGHSVEVIEPDDEDKLPDLSGPTTAPVNGVVAPDITDQLPTVTASNLRPIAAVGSHGGAGTSTLAAVAPSLISDVGQSWPVSAEGLDAQKCVVVARTSVAGLERLQVVLRQWASGETPPVELIGIVLIADAPGRLPKPIRQLIPVITSGGPRVWRVPWDANLRLVAAGDDVSMRGSGRLVRHLRKLSE